MKNILLIGAGRSASTLIKYLLDNSSKENWKITVAAIFLFLRFNFVTRRLKF